MIAFAVGGGTARCPCCQAESPLSFFTKDRNRRLSAETFRYYRCRGCRLLFLDPIPANLRDYYPPDYCGLLPSLKDLAACCQPEQYKVDLIKRFVPGGRLLEVGPGGGGFAYLAKRAGYEVEVVEMDGASCRFLAEVVGVRAIHSDDVAAAVAPEKPYDVIALWHVIEHLPDPWRALRAVAGRLAPGGILVLAAPNPDAFQFRVLGRYWTHIDAPRHLVLLPVRSLVSQVEALGLETTLVTTTDEGTLGWNVFGWRQSLIHLFKGRRTREVMGTLGGLISRLAGPVECGGLRGSTYTVIFRKG